VSHQSSETIAETFFQTIPCAGCAVIVVSEGESLSFERTLFHGFTGGLPQKAVEPVAVRLAWDLLQSEDPITRSRHDSDWSYAEQTPALRSILGVPIVARGQTLAIALLFNKQATRTSPGKEFTEDDLRMGVALRYQAAALMENARRHRLEYAMFDGFARSLAKAVDFRDRYTQGHSERVAEFSVGIARELGLSDAEVEVVQRAATLHDVGKIGVSDAVLNKPGKLTDEEFASIKAHPANGYEILKNTPTFEVLLPGIRHHHERHDGRGYPDGLEGEHVPLIARIIAAADAYDAMTSHRVYRRALPIVKARDELIKGCGSQFDTKVIRAFLKYLGKRAVRRKKMRRAASTRTLKRRVARPVAHR